MSKTKNKVITIGAQVIGNPGCLNYLRDVVKSVYKYDQDSQKYVCIHRLVVICFWFSSVLEKVM